MSDQKTSIAKDIQLDTYAQSALDNYGELTKEYNAPGNERTNTGNDGAASESGRTTSAAKDIQLDTYAQSALDNYGELTRDFNGQDFERGNSQDEGSQMVQKDAATNDNRPPPEMARDQDRKTFNQGWSAETKRADVKEDDYARQALEAYGEELTQEHGHGQDYGNDYSR